MRARIALALVLALGASAPVAAPAQAGRSAVRTCATPPAVAERLQAFLERAHRATPGTPGWLLHVEAPRLGVSWSGATGLDDRERRTRLRRDQTVRLASITKTYVSAAILRLVEERRLALDAPIGRYLPADLVARLPDGERITVEHLLRHTSGLYDYATDPEYLAAVVRDPRRRWTRQEQIDFALSHGEPYGRPGEVFHYSDTGYVLLGQILERRTGLRSYGDALERLLGLRRLGLAHTYLEDGRRPPPGTGARAHQYFGGFEAYDADPSYDLHGGGGLVADMRDVARFWDALFRGRVFERPATLRRMTTITRQDARGEAAMGIFRGRINGLRHFVHGGFFGTRADHFPARELSVSASWGDGSVDHDPLVRNYDGLFRALRGLRTVNPPGTVCR